MGIRPMRMAAMLLATLFALAACEDTGCGGCVTPLDEPFPAAPRVYDGVQVRVSQSGLGFIETNLPQIIDTLLADGLQFEIPPTTTSLLGVDIDLCQAGCPVTVEILDSRLTPIAPDRIQIDGSLNLDTTATVDWALGHCDFPVSLQEKPLSASVQLLIDADTYLLHFEVGSIEATIESSDYDIQCPNLYDWLFDLLKDFITDILNSQLQGQLDSAIGDMVSSFTCLPCDFYSGGCPAGSSCNGDGYCESGGACLVKPQGLVGTVELGEMLASVDPDNDAALDLMVAAGQAQQPNQRPFVRANGLEVRVIGGSYSDLNDCLVPPDQNAIPDTGIADAMQFGNLIPGQGTTYMVGLAVADMYLDHFAYQLWRSGFLCLAIDSYGLDLISSSTLGLIVPSVNTLTGGANVPVRLELHPVGVPRMEIGAGTFLPDGSVDEPILYLFLPNLRMDFWMVLDGRWTRFLSLTQDMQLDLALEFTADNEVVPVVDEQSIHVDNVQLLHYELLAEDEETLRGLVPSLINIALPQLLGTLEGLAIPDLQGFALDIKSVQGDIPRANTSYYEFMSIYADLGFAAPPPTPVETRLSLVEREGGWVLIGLADGLEAQYRLDGRLWTPFKRGSEIAVDGLIQAGPHALQVRARRVGDYRSLDPEPQWLAFQAPVALLPAERDLVARPTGRAQQASALDQADTEAAQAPRAGCATSVPGSTGPVGLILLALLGLRRRRR